MDELKDIAAVTSALTTLSEVSTQLKTLLMGQNNLSTNRNEISAAWKSDNATSFIGQYNTLIESIANAQSSLQTYAGKLYNVVSKFQGFDNTIQQGE